MMAVSKKLICPVVLAQFFVLAFAQPVLSQTTTGRISGQIRTDNGEPIVGVRVSAVAVPAESNVANTLTVMDSISLTDANGSYTLDNIPPGRYYVSAGLIGAPTYYPGVSNSNTATAVAVTADSVVRNINFLMARSSAGLRVSGRVSRSTEIRAGAQIVVLTGSAGQFQAPVASDGTFEILRVLPGTYSLRVQPVITPASAREIVVADKDVTDLQLQAEFPVSIAGIVEVATNAPLPRFTISLEDAKGIVTKFVPAIQSNGNFNMTLPTGEYRLAFSGFPSIYNIDSVTYGSVNLQNSPLNLIPDSGNILRIHFVLPRPDSLVNVSGHVTGAINRGTKDSPNYGYITLQSDSLSRLPDLSPIKPDGSFRITNVLPGTYIAATGPVRHRFVVDEKDLTGLEIVIPPDRQFSGRIVSSDGVPLPRVDLSFSGFDEIHQDTSVTGIAADGTFRVTLPEGSYRIDAEFPDAYHVKSIQSGSQLLDGTLRVGPSTSELVVTLESALLADWTRVRGRVTGASYLEAGQQRVVLSGPSLIRDLESAIDWTGAFTFEKVPPGIYTARIAQNPQGATSMTIVVRAGVRTIDDIVLKVGSQIPVMGRVIVADGTSLSRFSMMVTSPLGAMLAVYPPLPLLDTNGTGGLTVIPIQPDGRFRIMLAEGDYRVSALTPPSGFVVKSAASGAIDLLQQSLKVSAASPPDEIHITLAPEAK